MSRYHLTMMYGIQDTLQHSEMPDVSETIEIDQEPGPSRVSTRSPSESVVDRHDSLPDCTRDPKLFSENLRCFC